jgi:zinc transporter ZupT
MNAVLFSLAAFISTSAGGLCALGLRAHLHLVLGFAAGVLLGVVSFDLLPNGFELSRRLGGSGHAVMAALAAGFLLLHGLKKFALADRVHEDASAQPHRPRFGVISASALVGHSFLDGVGIGLAFQVSEPVGLAVAVAVITHDFCDGLNTVGLMLAHRSTTARALGMLVLDAVAPALGAASTLAYSAPPEALVLHMGLFAGFLLYVGAADIFPRARFRAGSAQGKGMIGLALLGVSLIYGLTRVTH